MAHHDPMCSIINLIIIVLRVIDGACSSLLVNEFVDSLGMGDAFRALAIPCRLPGFDKLAK